MKFTMLNLIKSKVDAGRLSSWYMRARERFGNLQTVMIVVIFLSTTGWYWWYPFIVVAFVIFIVFDIIYILPKEVEYNMTRSKSFKELLSMVRRLEEKIDKL